MLINFIGSPASGKTTTASMLFASLKETGVVCEYSSERARLYIARKRLQLKLAPGAHLALTDEDQLKIMREQVETDEALVASSGAHVLVVSDASALCSLLYMTAGAQISPEATELAARSVAITQVSFIMKPVSLGWGATSHEDPNRIHSLEESKLIDAKIPGVLSLFPGLKTVEVWGGTTDRLLTVQAYMLGAIK